MSGDRGTGTHGIASDLIFDWDDFLEALGGNGTLALELGREFCARYRSAELHLAELLHAGDRGSLRVAAHALVGAARSMRMPRLGRSAEALESAILAASPRTRLEARLAVFRGELSQAIERCEELTGVR